MDRLSPDQLDRQLGAWLREESATRAPARLVENVFATTSRSPQARSWWPPQVDALRGPAHRSGRSDRFGERVGPAWHRVSAIATGVAVVVVAVLGLSLLPKPGVGPGTSPTPIVTPTPSAEPTPTARSLAPAPSADRGPTPAPTVLGTLAAQRLDLGFDAAPISVTEAFGSIWVANIHAADVRRFDPVTMREQARIPVAGAAWFAVADGALWVTKQTSLGLARIDPTTNRVVAHVGDVAPCGEPVVAFGSLWQAACDANVILRIDPAKNAVIKRIPAQGHGFLVAAGGRLVATGPEGLASLDPDTGVFTEIPTRAATGAEFIASDGETVWVKNGTGMARLDPKDGAPLAGFPIQVAQAASFAGDHAWLTVTGQGVLEIDLATNKTVRTIPVLPSPLVALEAGGVLWVTDFDDSALWRIEL